mmetsp:Transcript_71767/g.199117  ORF Transcript_71767/g.199117 Transcript_71767/m.199117 type:complete len:222 (+) Transcript_71767:185-850(+)
MAAFCGRQSMTTPCPQGRHRWRRVVRRCPARRCRHARPATSPASCAAPAENQGRSTLRFSLRRPWPSPLARRRIATEAKARRTAPSCSARRAPSAHGSTPTTPAPAQPFPARFPAAQRPRCSAPSEVPLGSTRPQEKPNNASAYCTSPGAPSPFLIQLGRHFRRKALRRSPRHLLTHPGAMAAMASWLWYHARRHNPLAPPDQETPMEPRSRRRAPRGAPP